MVHHLLSMVFGRRSHGTVGEPQPPSPRRCLAIFASAPREGGCKIDADGWVRGPDDAVLGGTWGPPALRAGSEEQPAPALRIPLDRPMPPAPTTVISVSGNLPLGPAPAPLTAATEVYDHRGGRHSLHLEFVSAADPSLRGEELWSLVPAPTAPAGHATFALRLSGERWARLDICHLVFGPNGQVRRPDHHPTIRLRLRLGGQEQALDLDVGAGLAEGPGRLTAGRGPAFLAPIRCDGNPANLSLDACEETPSGYLVGHYAGGRARVLGRIRRSEPLRPLEAAGQAADGPPPREAEGPAHRAGP